MTNSRINKEKLLEANYTHYIYKAITALAMFQIEESNNKGEVM